MIKRILISLALCSSALTAHAATPLIAWQYSPSGATSSTGKAITRTNSYVYSVGDVTVSGEKDVVVEKYDLAGNLIWSQRYGFALKEDYASDITTDENGYIYVTGVTDSSAYGANDMWTFRLNGSGSVLWSNTYNGAGNLRDVGNRVRARGTGVYVATTLGWLGQNGYVSIANAGMIKYDLSTGTLVYANEVGLSGLQQDDCRDVAVDSSGNAYFVGYLANVAHVWKYSSTGSLLWDANLPGVLAERVLLDGSGNPIITTGIQVDQGAHIVRVSPNNGVVLDQFDYNVGQSWTSSMNSLFLDTQGRVYAGGSTWGPSSPSWHVHRLNSDLTPIWGQSHSTASVDQVLYDVSLDSNRNVYAVGRCNNRNMVVKWSVAGAHTWTADLGSGTGYRGVGGLANNLFTTGGDSGQMITTSLTDGP